MTKNPTPHQISVACAAIQTLVSLTVFMVFQSIFGFLVITPKSIALICLVLLLIFIVNYVIIINALRNFIYRKIKTIYKYIHKSKQAKGKLFNETSMNEDIIGNVNQEVADWAADTEKEIAQLKTTENFRKEFLGNVSHELKTPIFSIQGYVDTLLDGGLYDANVNKKYLSKANKNVDRLINIVNDLESITTYESGKMVMQFEEFDIIQLSRDTIDLFEMTAEERAIALKIKKGFAPSISVIGDRDKIQQVLTNLLSNSLKYGKDGGTTEIGFYDMDENILVEVSDNGVGIEKQDLPRLFERFYRVDKSRSRVAGGTGLGLSIVKHTMEAHNQTITVRSTPKVGSTFGFTLKKAI